MSYPKYFVDPFAISGDKIAVPDVPPSNGTVSYTIGFGPDYQLDLLTNPNALPVPRPQTNQIFYDITSNIQQYQQVGVANWITPTQNLGTPYQYAKYAYCLYDLGTGDGPQLWQSNLNANTSVPGADTNWRSVPSNVLDWQSVYTYRSNGLVQYLGNLYTSTTNANQGNIPGTPQWNYVGNTRLAVNYYLNAGFFNDAGGLNPTVNYIGQRTGSGIAYPLGLQDGMGFYFQPKFTNGSNPTLQLGPLPATPILIAGTLLPIPPGFFKPWSVGNGGHRYWLTYDGESDAFTLPLDMSGSDTFAPGVTSYDIVIPGLDPQMFAQVWIDSVDPRIVAAGFYLSSWAIVNPGSGYVLRVLSNVVWGFGPGLPIKYRVSL